MAAEAGATAFEARILLPAEVVTGRASRLVVVPEPGSAVLFASGIAALLWARRRQRDASGLDGAGGGR